MSARVYVETTIPSFFYEERPEAAMVARRAWTRAWWASAVGRDELVPSEAVLAELERGDFEARKACLELVTHLPLLRIDQAVLEIVDTYLRHHARNPCSRAGDSVRTPRRGRWTKLIPSSASAKHGGRFHANTPTPAP